MTTALFEVSSHISTRISELNVILNAAKEHDETNPLHKALCRSATILLSSHLEGFLKDVSKSALLDLQYNIRHYKDMPKNIRETFCRKIVYYEKIEEKDIRGRMTQLDAFFMSNSVKIELNAFNYNENPNKNPSPKNIDRPLKIFGLEDILQRISTEKILNIFEGSASSEYMTLRQMSKFRSTLYRFPYKALPSNYQFLKPKKASKKQISPSIWETFLDEVLERRHAVAHGDTMENIGHINVLRENVKKLEVLMYAILYCVSNSLIEQKSNNLLELEI